MAVKVQTQSRAAGHRPSEGLDLDSGFRGPLLCPRLLAEPVLGCQPPSNPTLLAKNGVPHHCGCLTRARAQFGKGHFSICHGTSPGAGEASPLPASQMPPAPKDALDLAGLELEWPWAGHEGSASPRAGQEFPGLWELRGERGVERSTP